MQPLRRLATSAFGTYAAYVAHGLRHPRLLRSQASPAERGVGLDGDELVRKPDWVTDFTTVIAASAADVWPWLVQMGYGRGGFYGWYRYDNGGVASADIIVPALQDLAVGDVIPDGPRANEGFGVWRVDTLVRERVLVLYTRRRPWSGLEVGPASDVPHLECSWAFVLEPLSPDHTKLHVRVRAAMSARARSKRLAKIVRLFLGFGDSVMENTMLEGIRRRAEANAPDPTLSWEGSCGASS